MNVEKIKYLREEFEYTQEYIANKLNVKRSTYSGYENKIDNIPLDKFIKLCNILNSTLDFITDISNTNNFSKDIYELDLIKLGQKLHDVRTKHLDLIKDVAKILGIDPNTYSRYERGLYMIQTQYLIAFAKYYNVSLDWLVT